MSRHGLKIAFGNKSRSGKDTSCEYLQKKYGGNVFHIAESLYEFTTITQKFFNQEVKKDPILLQTYGEFFRNYYDKDIWINNLIKKISNDDMQEKNIFIADLRYPNETEKLKSLGFILVNINRDNRHIDRDPNHPSEILLDNYKFDYIIDNNSDIDNLYMQLENMISIYFPL